MKYLCASLIEEKNAIIDLNSIVDIIYDYKQTIDNKQKFIFEDIEFRTGVDSVVSYDIDESINNLQTFGIIGKLNPTYEKIVIYLTKQDADTILRDCDPETRTAMSELANKFGR